MENGAPPIGPKMWLLVVDYLLKADPLQSIGCDRRKRTLLSLLVWIMRK